MLKYWFYGSLKYYQTIVTLSVTFYNYLQNNIYQKKFTKHFQV